MTMRIIMTAMALTATVGLLAGCGKQEPEVQTYKLTYPSDVKAGGDATSGLPANHPPVTPQASAQPPAAPMVNPDTPAPDKTWTWTTPAGWTEKPGGGFRMASFAVDGAPGADVSVTVLGPAAGGLTANVNRWRRQVGLAAQSEDEILTAMKPIKTSKGREALICDLRGEDGKSIRAGIVRTDEETLFVKMMGPTAELAGAAAAFDQLVSSMEKQ